MGFIKDNPAFSILGREDCDISAGDGFDGINDTPQSATMEERGSEPRASISVTNQSRSVLLDRPTRWWGETKADTDDGV